MRASRTTISVAPKSTFRQADGKQVLIAGPCSAESEEQLLRTAQLLKKVEGISVYKAGIWKSRTRPNNFEGMGTAGLMWLAKVKQETGLKTACDIVNAQQAEEALHYGVDILCISGRATVNPFATQEIAFVLKGTETPVLVNNPVYPDLKLWIGALERLNLAGITDLGAIHRGYATNEQAPYRNRPQWDQMLELKHLLPELPVICDASHIAGKRSLLYPISQRAVELGTDGFIFESHINPAEALSSRQHQLMPQELDLLVKAILTQVPLKATLNMVDKLDDLSKEISSLDSELIELLLKRSAAAKKLGQDKGLSAMSQANRLKSQLEGLLQQENAPGLDTELLKTIVSTLQQSSASANSSAA
jgi:chorismate mutase